MGFGHFCCTYFWLPLDMRLSTYKLGHRYKKNSAWPSSMKCTAQSVDSPHGNQLVTKRRLCCIPPKIITNIVSARNRQSGWISATTPDIDLDRVCTCGKLLQMPIVLLAANGVVKYLLWKSSTTYRSDMQQERNHHVVSVHTSVKSRWCLVKKLYLL